MGWLAQRFINKFKLQDLPRVKYPEHKFINGKRLHKSPWGYLPGATTVLGQTKDSGSKVALDRWRQNNPEEGKRVLARGRNLDDYVGKFWSGVEIMNDSSVTTKLSPQDKLNQQIDEFLSVLAPCAIEYPLASLSGFCGSPDAIAQIVKKPSPSHPLASLPKDSIILIDFKTSTKKKTDSKVKDYFLQLGAYSHLIKENFNFDISYAVIAMACEETGHPLFWILHTNDITKYRLEFFNRLEQYNEEYSDGF